MQIRSDFLAVNVAARVIISKLIDSDDDDVDSNDASSSSSSSTTSRARPGERPPASAAMRVVFDRTVATLSAVQFSYVAPLRPSSHDQNTVRKDANEKLKVEL